MDDQSLGKFDVLTDQEIIQHIHQGEHALFEVLIERHEPRILRYVTARKITDRIIVDEVCHEVFLRAWNRLEHFDGRAPFRSWLYGIARNTLSEYLRDTQRHSASQDSAETTTEPSGTAELAFRSQTGALQLDIVRQSLDHMSTHSRTLLLARFEDGASLTELSQRYGKSIHSISKEIDQIMNRLTHHVRKCRTFELLESD